MNKRIGLFGGSFDPVHNGHVQVAEKAIDSLSLDTFFFYSCLPRASQAGR